MLARLCNLTGKVLAVLGAIASISALFYWINGFFLLDSPYHISMALSWFVVGLVFYGLAGVSFKVAPDTSGA